MPAFRIDGATASYPHLFVPRAASKRGVVPPPDARKRYSIALILNANDPQINKIITARAQVIKEKYPDGQLPYGFKDLPMVKGEVRYPGDPAYAGKLIVNAYRQESMGQVPTVDENNVKVMDAGKVYAGCIVNALISVYAHNNNGITIGLEAVQFVTDGPRLDNRPDVSDVFSPVEGTAPGPVSLPTTSASPGGNPWD